MSFASPGLNASASPQVEITQIDSKLNELDRELQMLRNLCGSIHDRCQSVMNPAMAEKASGATPRPILSPLGERISNLTGVAIDVNRGLTDFLTRLAL